jgi:hypothetical protein
MARETLDMPPRRSMEAHFYVCDHAKHTEREQSLAHRTGRAMS